MSPIYIDFLFDILKVKVPKVGGAEMLKVQEAIPPFSLIVDSIHGRRAETLVKTAKSCWLQLSPSLLLTIPARTWAPSSFTTVSGPPLSPWVKTTTDVFTFWFVESPCMVLWKHPQHTQSGLHLLFLPGSFSRNSCYLRRWESQSLAAHLSRSLELQCLPSLRSSENK